MGAVSFLSGNPRHKLGRNDRRLTTYQLVCLWAEYLQIISPFRVCIPINAYYQAFSSDTAQELNQSLSKKYI